MKRIFSHKSLLILGILLLIIIFQNCSEEQSSGEKSGASKQEARGGLTYVGDQQCVSCHGDQQSDWTGSHHDWAMKEPKDSNILGDFSNQALKIDGVDYFFSKKNGSYYVHVRENGLENSYKIWKTFGFWPLQQYLVKGENGEVHTLRVSWNSEEKKWYHQYLGEKIAPKDWLHWTKGGQRWNTMCADCHSTDVRKNYDVEADQFSTTYKTMNVGCEACHGPGSKHIIWAQDPQTDEKGIFKPVEQTAIINQCGPCHSRRSKLRDQVLPWEDFHQNHILQNLSPDFYEVDGQIKEEDYVLGSFLSSKMFHEGVKCTDCHNPHSLKLKAKGNNLCLSCHEPKYDKEEHHHHPISSVGAECVNCHMPGKTYMGHDFRRDHSFRVPRPDQSIIFGTSNACNDCHADKTANWASQKVIQWYGPDRQPHYSDYLAMSSKTDLESAEQEKLVAFVNNDQFPEIARSTVIENLQNKLDQEYFIQLIEANLNSSPLILNSLLNYFGQDSPEARLYVARQHLFHPSRPVRQNATSLLLDIPRSQLSAEEINQLNLNEKELLQTLLYNADFPTGRLQLGDYYMKKQQIATAIRHYLKALEMDSLLLPVYSNLATAYNLNQENDKALSILDQAIKLDRKNGQYDYLKGILLYEMKRNEEALVSLNQSINKSPYLVKSYHNLALIYFEMKNMKLALKTVKEGLVKNPSSKELRDLQTYLLEQESN